MKLLNFPESSLDVINCSYKHPQYNPKIVASDEGEHLGYLWYPEEDCVIEIEMIEVIDKGKGTGSEIIRFLFDKLDLVCVKGCLLREKGERPYHFWKNLGAEIEGCLEDYDDADDGITFYLFKENLK